MKLQPVHESSGWRHYLDGRPVHSGTSLQLLVSDRPHFWIDVRYEGWIRADGICAVLHSDFGRVLADCTTEMRWPQSP